jgi:hypothetical protein
MDGFEKDQVVGVRSLVVGFDQFRPGGSFLPNHMVGFDQTA